MKCHENTEDRILGNLLLKPLDSKSIHQIALTTGLSYVTAHRLMPDLIKKKLVKMEKKGKASLISIDFEHAELEKLSSAILYERGCIMRKYPKLTLILREIEEALSGKFYVLVLFGSYAKGRPKKESDLDFLFIVQRREEIEIYREMVNKALRLYPTIKKDFNIVTTKDFMKMLNQKYSVGREAFLHGVVLFGAENYYVMVKDYVRKKGYT